MLLGGCAIQIPLSLKGPSRATNAKYVNAHTLPYMHFDFVDLWGTVEIFLIVFWGAESGDGPRHATFIDLYNNTFLTRPCT